MIGEIISDKYKIVAPLSESLMYEVFKADEIATGATVVVKILKENMAASSDRVKCFSDEIRAFASISHPLVAEILDIDMLNDRPYVVTQLVEGNDLHTWIKGDTLPFSEVIKIMQDLATLLQYASDQQVSCRTIKLSNVIRSKDGKLRVLSFTHPRLKLVGNARTNENSGVQSDLYFLGNTMFELLTGESPIRNRGGLNELWDMKLESLLRVRHSDLTPDQISKVVGFIRRTLTREMENRFASHEEFLKAIADLAGIVRSNASRQRARQLSMASQVVDALNGRMSNVNTAMPAMMPKTASLAAAVVNQAPSGDVAENTEIIGTGETISGNLALAAKDDEETGIPELNDDMPELKNSRRPALRLLKNDDVSSDKKVWNEAEETHWLRNPVIFMGLCLLIMVLMILFW
ncbi:MAG: serine/threonine protein kinase [Candidatus Rifleibacteriota bacterium]